MLYSAFYSSAVASLHAEDLESDELTAKSSQVGSDDEQLFAPTKSTKQKTLPQRMTMDPLGYNVH